MLLSAVYTISLCAALVRARGTGAAREKSFQAQELAEGGRIFRSRRIGGCDEAAVANSRSRISDAVLIVQVYVLVVGRDEWARRKPQVQAVMSDAMDKCAAIVGVEHMRHASCFQEHQHVLDCFETCRVLVCVCIGGRK